MKIINSDDFDKYWSTVSKQDDDPKTEKIVKKIIASVRKDGDAAVKHYASKFDKSSPEKLEVPFSEAIDALEKLRAKDPSLAEAMEFSARNIMRFSQKQKEQFVNFDCETDKGIIAGQRVIPVQRAAVYIPGGRFPLFSSVLMCMLPAFCAGVEEVILSSPPAADGLPDKRILAAAAIAAQQARVSGISDNKLRIFAMGGAQAIAALALGTQTVPRADVIAGPGNKYVAAAKRILFGETGIDFIAGPTDILIIADNGGGGAAELIAADMLGQAEHDPDSRARALVPNAELAEKITEIIKRQLEKLPTEKTARASLDNGSLIVVYKEKEEAVRIANIIAPEHLELQTEDTDAWIPLLKNYGSLFIGALSAEVLGDYSAGINHTLPTSTSARFTGGLSVRNFLKTVTTLRCVPGEGFEKARNAAEIMARAEGLEGHARSAEIRK
ncbi:MAG: histidinol dehydrogenase [Treponema sp.]|nr:histidinol dehydrogenase [Treponema sp.]